MEDEKRTQFAMAAVDFAGLFNQMFAESVAPGTKLELTAPEGQSTGGGVQALQHVRMINQTEGISLVIGSCNNFERTAEIRSFGRINQQFKERYPDKAFPVGEQAYNHILEKLKNFFESQGIPPTVSETVAMPAARPAAHPKASSGGMSAMLWVLIAVLVAALGGAVYYFFFYQQ